GISKFPATLRNLGLQEAQCVGFAQPVCSPGVAWLSTRLSSSTLRALSGCAAESQGLILADVAAISKSESVDVFQRRRSKTRTPNIGVFERQDLAFSEDANILASKDANQFAITAIVSKLPGLQELCVKLQQSSVFKPELLGHLVDRKVDWRLCHLKPVKTQLFQSRRARRAF
ncbi:Protein KlaB, partial [Frankliniella fusca]